MVSKISFLAHDFNILREEHGKLSDRVKGTDAALGDIHPAVISNTAQVQDLLEQL